MSQYIDANIEESSGSEISDDGGWIGWFCSLKGNELFVEVDDDYIRDSFNLYGLRSRVRYYDLALDQILGSEAPDEEDVETPRFMEIYKDATELYGLIHARFLITPRGLSLAHHKYSQADFGQCPRVMCRGQRVLPVGIDDHHTRQQAVKLFCPLCEQIYGARPRHSEIDGCYFGTSFPHVFLQAYPHLVPTSLPRPYVARIFGFKLHDALSSVAQRIERGGDYGPNSAALEDGEAGQEEQDEEPAAYPPRSAT